MWKSRVLILVLGFLLASGASAEWPDWKKTAADLSKVLAGKKTGEEKSEEATAEETEQAEAGKVEGVEGVEAAELADTGDTTEIAEAVEEDENSIDSQVQALEIEQELIVRQYVVASLQLSEAQILLATALGLDEQAALVRAEADALAADNSVDDKDLKRQAKLSESTSRLVRKKIARGHELSVEGKKQYGSGMLQYALGLEESKVVMENVEPFYDKTLELGAQTAATARGITVNNILQRSKTLLAGGSKMVKKFKTVGFLVKESDDFAILHKETLTAVIEFARSNDIAIPEEATAVLDFV